MQAEAWIRRTVGTDYRSNSITEPPRPDRVGEVSLFSRPADPASGFRSATSRPLGGARLTWGRRLGVLLPVIAALAAGFARADAAGLPSAGRPNLVFLLSDDQRADTIHALGNRQIRTPNLDRLCREGTVLTRASIMGAMQGAVCVPSRAMLLSGRTLFRAPENLAGVRTWPRQLGDAGYRTFIIGKWHNSAQSVSQSFQEGEAVFLGGMTDQWRVKVQDLGRDGRWSPPRVEARFSSEVFADAAVRYLTSRAAEEPFLLYVAFTAPHDPRTPPPAFREAYAAERLPLPPNFLAEHPFDNGELQVRDERLLPCPRMPSAVRGAWADYYGMITHLDAQVGRILQALEQSGQAERTWVVFAGDNGLALGSHGLLGKQNLYEHSLRVPLLVKGPGVGRGRRVDVLCQLQDLCPTLCELAGVLPPEGNEGMSLVPWLREGRGAGRGRGILFSAYRDVQRAVSDGRWKLIEYPRAGRTQLFDLRRDRFERRDLGSDERYGKERERLRAELVRQQRALGDPLVGP